MSFIVGLLLGVAGTLLAVVGGLFVLRSFGRRSSGGSRTGLGVGLIVLGAAALIAAPFAYAALNDAPDELDEGDLTAALATDPPGAVSADTTAPSAPAPTDAGTTSTTGSGAPAASSWVATADSIVGYRIQEVLFGVDTAAVGRSNAVTGSIEFDGTTLTAAEFSVDMVTLESDDGRRDNQYRQIMSVSEFPTATFTLTEPIEVGVEPVDGASVVATATGELTLRGATLPVTFEVTAQVDNGKLGVLGNIPIVFADYGIANPSRAGITTEDHGLLEFVLVFAPA